MKGQSSGSRIHSMDALRASSMLLLVPVHAAMLLAVNGHPGVWANAVYWLPAASEPPGVGAARVGAQQDEPVGIRPPLDERQPRSRRRSPRRDPDPKHQASERRPHHRHATSHAHILTDL
jgi:hypothetical protein